MILGLPSLPVTWNHSFCRRLPKRTNKQTKGQRSPRHPSHPSHATPTHIFHGLETRISSIRIFHKVPHHGNYTVHKKMLHQQGLILKYLTCFFPLHFVLNPPPLVSEPPRELAPVAQPAEGEPQGPHGPPAQPVERRLKVGEEWEQRTMDSPQNPVSQLHYAQTQAHEQQADVQ